MGLSGKIWVFWRSLLSYKSYLYYAYLVIQIIEVCWHLGGVWRPRGSWGVVKEPFNRALARRRQGHSSLASRDGCSARLPDKQEKSARRENFSNQATEWIVGTYEDANGVLHGFEAVATPEPGTVMLLGSGLSALAWWRRRRV